MLHPSPLEALEAPARPWLDSARRVLIVDCDHEAVACTEEALHDEGYEVLTAADAEEGVRILRDEPVDLVLLELVHPTLRGFGVFRHVRSATEAPVIITSVRADHTDRIVGLELGADDYVAKPYSAREVVARVGVVLRRYTREPLAVPKPRPVAVPDFAIDGDARGVRKAGRLIPLTPTEFRLLDVLARNNGRVLTRAQLLELVAAELDVSDRVLDKHIANLRRKIEDDPSSPRRLITVFGLGYKYVA